MKDLSSIVAKFKVQGTIEEIKPLGAGLINDTYKVNTKEADAPNYVLQRINHAIFQNVEMRKNTTQRCGDFFENRRLDLLFPKPAAIPLHLHDNG